MALYIGLMSGTSIDGVDGVLVDLDDAENEAPERPPLHPRALAFVHRDMDAALHQELLSLNQPGQDELHRAALATEALMAAYAAVVHQLLETSGTRAAAVRAIGAHGQTVRHRPGEFNGRGYTLQLVNGALLTELTHIDVVCDFRSRDVAAGGQGAPLVPAFHQRCLAQAQVDVAVLNLGGIANLSLLPPSHDTTGRMVLGFDTGPANVLMDLWCRRERAEPYDEGGRWAAGGRVDDDWLKLLRADPYFGQLPPKSTGRDLFNADWLQRQLPYRSANSTAQDVVRTLLELTVTTVVDALQTHAPGTAVMQICGGGAHNQTLMDRLAALCPDVQVQSTATAGIPPDQIEAMAFAWLAQAMLQRRPGNLPAVTGALGPRVLGALYPALPAHQGHPAQPE